MKISEYGLPAPTDEEMNEILTRAQETPTVSLEKLASRWQDDVNKRKNGVWPELWLEDLERVREWLEEGNLETFWYLPTDVRDEMLLAWGTIIE